MRITEYNTKWVHDKVEKYCKQMGIVAVPKVLLTSKEVLALPLSMTEGRRTSAYKYYGVYYDEAHMIFVNIFRHETLKKVDDTIAHELVHARFPALSHNEKFNKIVKAIIRGARYKNYSRMDMWIKLRIKSGMKSCFGEV